MKNNKSILICSNYCWTIYNFRLNLIRKLKSEGYNLFLLTKKDKYSSLVDIHFNKSYNLSIDLNGKNIFRELLTFFNVLFILMKVRPTFFLTFTIKPNFYGLLASFFTNTNTIPNVTGLGTLHSEHCFFGASIKFLYRLCFVRSYHAFFQNSDDLETFNLRFISSRIKQSVLPGSGVNITKFSPNHNTTKKSNPLKFLFFGRLLKEKGVIEYLEAARHFYQHGPKHNFFILGFLDSENKSAISFEDLIPYIDHYNVTYLEPTDDVSSILCDFDCVVFPSYYFEGVPRCLIEAASCGLPIITNNSRGCREVVDDGFNGFLCEPKNTKLLISKINEFINLSFKSRLQMGKNSRYKALKYFDEEIVLNSYLNVLKSYEYL